MLYNLKHNACLYRASELPDTIKYVPGAKYLDKADVWAVPCTLMAMAAMAQLRLPAVSPIITQYDWPSNKMKVPNPFDHQRVVSSFLTLNPRAFNLSDIGTGKTLATLWAFEYLKRQGILHKALVLSPLSTLDRVWTDEIRNHFLGRLTSTVLHGDAKKRLSRLQEDKDVYIINHDGIGVGSGRGNDGRLQLGPLATAIAARTDIDCIIVDEGSVFKDSGTNRYKLLRQMVKDKNYIWWLTGGPTPNSPMDAWAQARLVRKDYTESYLNMREKTMNKVTAFKWAPRKDADKYVGKVLSPAIRFHREDCLDLPPVTYSTLEVELSDAQKKAYAELKKTLRSQIEEGKGTITAVNEGVLRLKLLQVALGAVYGPERSVSKVDCAPRLRVLEEIIEQTEGKLLVFCPLISVTDLLVQSLSSRYSVAKINGETTPKSRSDIFLNFQSADTPRIIVADPRTMAHGLTLTAAATIVWSGPTDQAEIYTQANGRINRPGQTKSMHIIRLVATPVEREIFKRLDNKEAMQGAILDIIKKEE